VQPRHHRGFRIFLWITGTLLVLVILAVIGLSLFLSNERVKGWLVTTLSKATGREATVGAVDFSLDGTDPEVEVGYSPR